MRFLFVITMASLLLVGCRSSSPYGRFTIHSVDGSSGACREVAYDGMTVEAFTSVGDKDVLPSVYRGSLHKKAADRIAGLVANIQAMGPEERYREGNSDDGLCLTFTFYPRDERQGPTKVRIVNTLVGEFANLTEEIDRYLPNGSRFRYLAFIARRNGFRLDADDDDDDDNYDD